MADEPKPVRKITCDEAAPLGIEIASLFLDLMAEACNVNGALATLSTVPRERRDMPVVKTALSVVRAFQTSRLQRSMVLLPAVHGAPRPVAVAHANGN